ncbi:hypothetical protein ACQPWY_33925 [Pseudonocardia xinjiangensis]|uniref:hypothetical protein n=1 Tax=Pseudonocardia xinjiangensis TaxID=75289 RepID=UPI003D8CEA8A
MLKKLGMVAAVATAGMLALSPLAFAGDKDDHGDRSHDRSTSRSSSDTSVAVEDNSVQRNQVNVCEFDQDSSAVGGLAGPILPLPTQIQMLNCVNIGDGGSLVAPLAPGAPLPLLGG